MRVTKLKRGELRVCARRLLLLVCGAGGDEPFPIAVEIGVSTAKRDKVAVMLSKRGFETGLDLGVVVLLVHGVFSLPPDGARGEADEVIICALINTTALYSWIGGNETGSSSKGSGDDGELHNDVGK